MYVCEGVSPALEPPYVREGVSPAWERGLGVCSCPGPMGVPNDVIQQLAQLLAMQLESPWH